jgi:hypothetical protein
VYCSMRLGDPFIAPRQLGAVGAPFGRQFLPSVRWSTGRGRESPDWLVSFSMGHQMVRCGALDGPVRHMTVGSWSTWQIAVARLVHRTVRCLARTVW